VTTFFVHFSVFSLLFYFILFYFILFFFLWFGMEATFNMNCIYVCIFNALLHGHYSSNFRFTFL
jgi:hypothetical protein